MSAGNDLLFRGARREFKHTDSVFRHEGQERGKRDFAVAQRQVILLGPPAIVNMGAEEARFAQGKGLGVVMPAEEFLALGMAEVVPVTDHLGREGGEHLGKFFLVRKLLEFLPDLEAETDFVFSRHLNQRVEAGLDPGPEPLEIFLALLHRLHLDVRISAVQKASVEVNVFQLAGDPVGTRAAEVKNDGLCAELGRLADGFLARLDRGVAHRRARIGKLVTVRVGTENARRHRAEIMQRLDLDQVLLPRLHDARPKGKADRVAQFADGEPELPDFLEHRVTILMPVRIPARGEGQRQHELRPT